MVCFHLVSPGTTRITNRLRIERDVLLGLCIIEKIARVLDFLR